MNCGKTAQIRTMSPCVTYKKISNGPYEEFSHRLNVFGVQANNFIYTSGVSPGLGAQVFGMDFCCT
jgi:hypothetical protein